MQKGYKGFIRYNYVAVLSALSDWGTFWVLHQFGVFFIYSQMIARLVGGVVSFIINKYWSFQSPERSYIFLQGRRFIMLFIFSYFLSNYLLYVFVEWFKFSLFGSKLIADGTCYIVNFFIMKSYVYATKRSISRSLKDFMFNRFKIS